MYRDGVAEDGTFPANFVEKVSKFFLYFDMKLVIDFLTLLIVFKLNVF